MENQNSDKPLIIAVDDEQLNIELLSFILERNDIDFKGTQDDGYLFELLEEKLPDLILLDVVMPRIEGFELCEKIKSYKKYKEIPVIFLTGKVNVKDKVKGFQVGGVDYVTKPFNEQELIARIQTHVALVRAKNQIKEQAENLRQSNALKDRMFSIIGHDLRSPLSAAKLKMDFIIRGIIDPKSDDFLDGTVFGLLKTMDEALNLLQNLLGWAKAESDQIQVIPEQLDIHELVDQTIRLLKLSSDHKKITLKNAIAANTMVYADVNTIKTVLRNLVSNAIKFTPTSGLIQVNAIAKNERLVIEVSDNGQGIPKEDIEKILNPNEHFSKLGTNKEPGTGLGLILCQNFIHKNGGQLNIKSKVGKGSTFYFDLPVLATAPA
ncbi:Response regulator receiver sensor signal transduction histidine kinase [Croceitalea dokdonensis DOKDO 023]|uniref:histidine kinase n=1 Tax=Croceitalea dokdonensis DOKDO 023 TaxID=1300341 RepID=A0A0P7A467_9FLAO|nr:hybrid sensor histidine kinase/response regulator [Croceitalea dokdonensis]KPM31205.1 Response regulator receiver sensor signal transduction histidine kinase [Croceitalea dokdonensis DOKDO 023]